MAVAIYNPAKEITALGKAQSTAANIGLKTAQTKSLADLAATQAKIEPEYYKQRNALSTNTQVAQKNFAEYMAQRGQNTATGASGTMNQAEITRGASLQGGLGSLATGQANANAENLRQVGEANTAYNTGVAQSNATINATTMQSLIAAQQAYNAAQVNQANADRAFNAQQAQQKLDNAYRAQQAAAARAAASRSSGGGGGGGSSSSNKTESKAGILAAFNSLSDAVEKKAFLDTNKSQIIAETGAANWQNLENKWASAYKAQVAATPNQYASWNMQNLK